MHILVKLHRADSLARLLPRSAGLAIKARTLGLLVHALSILALLIILAPRAPRGGFGRLDSD